MTIPTIVVRNAPVASYLEQYKTPGLSQRHMALDCARFLSQVGSLKEAMTIKNKDTEREIKGLLTGARNLEKNIDYCAFFTASLPKVNILDQDSNKYDLGASIGPYVVRAMASAKTIHHAEKTNQDYIFLENGYFGNYKSPVNQKSRKIWHRACVNMLQQETILDVPDDRWTELVVADSRLKWSGWKKSGSKILLVLPSSKPCQYYNENSAEWKDRTIEEIKKHTNREIVVREKASRLDRTQKKTIYEALDEDIFCTVTYQSIAAVESIAYGIPAFVLAPSAANPVALSDLSKIETPRYEDPQLIHKWCSSLAYGQFSIEEMLNGYAWNTVMENKTRATISS